MAVEACVVCSYLCSFACVIKARTEVVQGIVRSCK